MNEPSTALRIDKWLWQARFVRHRELVQRLLQERRVRLNNQVVSKTHQLVRPGDVLTVTEPARVRVLKVLALGDRRGPATEARVLYEELAALD
ncbi:MAG: S4 domain-containing protein [Geminicoccaceae bacterium]